MGASLVRSARPDHGGSNPSKKRAVMGTARPVDSTFSCCSGQSLAVRITLGAGKANSWSDYPGVLFIVLATYSMLSLLFRNHSAVVSILSHNRQHIIETVLTEIATFDSSLFLCRGGIPECILKSVRINSSATASTRGAWNVSKRLRFISGHEISPQYTHRDVQCSGTAWCRKASGSFSSVSSSRSR